MRTTNRSSDAIPAAWLRRNVVQPCDGGRRRRKTLARLGIELPKPEPQLPRWVEIGRWRPYASEVSLTRGELFERVWSEPVSKLAKEWGLSDRGLGKVCLRLKIPVPPRGYWARLQHGQKLRRPGLPELKPGEAEKIVIRLPG